MVRCVCRSIKPGSKVASPKSSTVAPGGTLRLAPTSAIFSPSTRTIAGTSGARPRPSIRRPALIIVMGAGVGCVSATAGRHVVPPSATRKHPSFRSRIFMNGKLAFAAPVHQASNFQRPRERWRHRDDRMAICCEKSRMDETKTPTRDEIPEADKWDLSHLFSSANKWSEDFAWIQIDLSSPNELERAGRRIGPNAGRVARVRQGARSENRARFSLRFAPVGRGQRESRLSRADGAVAEFVHQNRRDRVLHRAGNPGDR